MSSFFGGTRRAFICGCAGPTLLPDEAAFLRESQPLGFILFARNCESPAQVRALTSALRDTVRDPEAFVLIDQEGGRVARLGPPHWRRPPAGEAFDQLAGRNAAAAERACYLNARLIAADLVNLGITVDCYPVLDLRVPGADAVIGNRSLGTSPTQVATLGRMACQGLLDGGVLPVIKHMPGHGRTTVDSHHSLPVVSASLDVLQASDFEPFRALADMPIGMTGHVCYQALDGSCPATTSALIIERVIRGAIGFDGLLLSDDLSMAALSGTRAERAKAALDAGCDVALHCNGRLEEMCEIASVAPVMRPKSVRRYERALGMRRTPVTTDPAALCVELAGLMGEARVA
ncbi:MAG: beta-N-acetylhexosaminidase [Alphaproteobacteria bacterium]|nr:beta-N-acetylhexosaminidase [Alphaproteobacteria bacterium]